MTGVQTCALPICLGFEKLLSDVVVALGDTRQNEEQCRAGMSQVFSHLVALHFGQNRLEIRLRVTHKGNKEQAALKAPTSTITLNIVVSAPQHAMSAIIIGVNNCHVGIPRNHCLPARVLFSEIGVGELLATRKRCAVELVAPDHQLLLTKRLIIPALHVHFDTTAAHIRAVSI